MGFLWIGRLHHIFTVSICSLFNGLYILIIISLFTFECRTSLCSEIICFLVIIYFYYLKMIHSENNMLGLQKHVNESEERLFDFCCSQEFVLVDHNSKYFAGIIFENY